jgi:2-C-methyl-D-erythritol 2,4-cyclodiphosphate synthase
LNINVIIAAAGSASRANTEQNKIFIKSAEGKSALWYSVNMFLEVAEVSKIIIAAKPGEFREIIKVFDEDSRAALNGCADGVLNRMNSGKVLENNVARDNGGGEKNDGRAPIETIEFFCAGKKIILCAGGRDRFSSVKSALRYTDEACKTVLIHDAARPYAERALIDRVISDAAKYDSAVPAVPVADTMKILKKETPTGADTPGIFESEAPTATDITKIFKNDKKTAMSTDRKNYLSVSTPQGYAAAKIRAAYAVSENGVGFTDDSSVYEKYIAPPHLTEGQSSNTKITTESDVRQFENYDGGFAVFPKCAPFVILEKLTYGFADGYVPPKNTSHTRLTEEQFTNTKNAVLRPINEQSQNTEITEITTSGARQFENYGGGFSLRVGNGYDLHRFAEGRRFILGCTEIPHGSGLLGHSDADALTHSIIDALFSAAGERDIGCVFPDGGEEFKDISGTVLLERARRILEKKRVEIICVSSVVIAEAPKLSPHVTAMKRAISSALKIAPERVSISCKTNERTGLIGDKKALAAYSVCLVAVNGEGV